MRALIKPARRPLKSWKTSSTVLGIGCGIPSIFFSKLSTLLSLTISIFNSHPYLNKKNAALCKNMKKLIPNLRIRVSMTLLGFFFFSFLFFFSLFGFGFCICCCLYSNFGKSAFVKREREREREGRRECLWNLILVQSPNKVESIRRRRRRRRKKRKGKKNRGFCVIGYEKDKMTKF